MASYVYEREELKKIRPIGSSRNILNMVIKKKPNDASPSVIKKRIRTAKNIYEIFSAIGYEKIRLTTFTASSIKTFTDDNIKYIKGEKTNKDSSSV
ncbi:uncharacterized protein OCT59_005925 [Rhizophagus irregularis]|uniref:Uncharacterized protein n=1 Tax=Rhizophagus irregularis (strain DAOM 197198w) TaxID=1432141 RepID=A0A015JTY1_RHIIW|nr:hypothetical protein RirG_269580 [Rhizophagus irregularis DAOM 197198w]UZO14468.1 hypothetical protein OCT59_005925 [Rhizophagus irregularis]GBC38172.1 hypothetical protein GLOIN_2v1789599 [Rhizophagus irregularis DAOM 181602=DAOM 197198]